MNFLFYDIIYYVCILNIFYDIIYLCKNYFKIIIILLKINIYLSY